VIISGASSGIGRALARELAAARARLLLSGRREDRLRGLARELGGTHGPAVACVGDLTDPDQRAALIATATQQWGGLDILINNAGIGAVGLFRQSTPERLRRVMEINFFAAVELTRAALPLLRRGRDPAIMNVGSVLGHFAVPAKSEYCASKFALHGWSDALRMELAPDGIDVLLLSPSTTATEFFDRAGATSPARRRGMAPEIVARQAVRALRSGRRERILSAGGTLLVWCDRILPGLTDRVLARFAPRN
jgi:short-subunit dehydrogenase